MLMTVSQFCVLGIWKYCPAVGCDGSNILKKVLERKTETHHRDLS